MKLLLGANGTPAQNVTDRLFNSSVQVLADVSGEFYDQDRPRVIHGRLANPTRVDEMVMSADAAQLLNLHVGDVVRFGFYTNAQTLENGYGTAALTPRSRIGCETGRDRAVRFRDRSRRLRQRATVRVTDPRRRRGRWTDAAPTVSRPASNSGWQPRRQRGRSRDQAEVVELVGCSGDRGGGGDRRKGHRSAIDRARRVRCDRGTGRAAHRRSGDRSPAAHGCRRPRHAARVGREPGHDCG